MRTIHGHTQAQGHGQGHHGQGQMRGNPHDHGQNQGQNQGYEQEQWEARDDQFDTALYLASHAQRLKSIENSLGQYERIIHDLSASQSEARRQQKLTLIGSAACIVLSIGLSIIVPSLVAAPAAPNAAAKPVAAAPKTAPVAAGTPAIAAMPPRDITRDIAPAVSLNPPPVIVPPSQPAVSPATAAALTPPAAIEAPARTVKRPPALSPFQNEVTARLAAHGESIPASWQAFFDRDAQGDRKGKLLVAARFLKGDGVTRDADYAVTLIRQAADAGEKEAMMWLAYANQSGNLGKVNPAAAVQWFEAAGKAGVATAYTELGRMYETGIDGAPDVDTAIAWYQRGAKAGDARASEAVNRLLGGTPRPQQNPTQNQMQNQPTAQQPRSIAEKAANTPINEDTVPLAVRDRPPLYASVPAAVPAATPVAASMPVPSMQTGMAPEQATAEIRRVQRMLKALGYKIDKADGEYGPQTATAIRAYQRDRTLYPDGEPSPQLLEALNRDMQY
jgi:hypothetical protein